MELGTFGFQRSDLLKIAEQIYDAKAKKQELELELSNEQFHYQYIPKRKDIIIHRMIFRLLFIISITLFLVMTLGNFFWFFLDMFLLYADIRLVLDEVKMLSLFLKVKDKVAIDERNMNSFQLDEFHSRKRIESLKEEIAKIEGEIVQLEEHQKELLEQKQKGEDFLRSKGVLFDKNPNVQKEKGKFSLREESVAMGNEQDIYDFYIKEEQYIHNCMMQIEGRLQKVNQRISQIDEDFNQMKKLLIFFVICYVFLILIQGAFSGILSIVISIICLIITVIAIIHLERKCKPIIILYLVEHEHSIIQEYAFCRNMVPVRMQRQELLEKMKGFQLELASIKEKKQALNF